MAVLLECDVLRNARENLGLSAGEVAKAANVSLRQYQRFESGERSLSASSFTIARRILEALELDISSFGRCDGGISDEPIIEYQEQLETAYSSDCKVFQDKICVFIGRLERCSRQEAQDRVFAAGGIPQSNIAAFANFVVAGKIVESTKVYQEAKRYESHGLLTILTEQEFFDALEGKYMPPLKAGGDTVAYDPNIPALLNQKRAAYIASKKIIGMDGILLDARSSTAVQSFVQRYMHTTLANQVRGHYQNIINDLERGAELLLDMSRFREEHKDGHSFSFGYKRNLTSDQSKAIVYAESFLKSIEDSGCSVKLRKKRNSTPNEHRIDQSHWMKAAAAEIRCKLNSTLNDNFWTDRNPLFLHLQIKNQAKAHAIK